jgi:geranylgeranyl pyrophosphate synthase
MSPTSSMVDPAAAEAPRASSRQRAERVLDCLEEIITSAVEPAATRELLTRHLAVGRRQAEQIELACVDLPMGVHAAVAGTEEAAVPLAAACTAIYLGADLLDDLADRDLEPEWADSDPGSATLAGAALLSAIPQLAIAQLPVDASQRVAIAEVLAETLLAMAVGQHGDLSQGGAGVTLAQARAVAEGKAGAEFAGFAAVGALLAGANATEVGYYRQFGAALGTACQIASDLAELWQEDNSADVANGTHTLPLVHAMTRGTSDDAALLLELLGSRGTAETAATLRALLLRVGSVAYTTLVVQQYCVQARNALGAVDAHAGPRAQLQAMVDRASLLPSRAVA